MPSSDAVMSEAVPFVAVKIDFTSSLKTPALLKLFLTVGISSLLDCTKSSIESRVSIKTLTELLKVFISFFVSFKSDTTLSASSPFLFVISSLAKPSAVPKVFPRVSTYSVPMLSSIAWTPLSVIFVAIAFFFSLA